MWACLWKWGSHPMHKKRTVFIKTILFVLLFNLLFLYPSWAQEGVRIKEVKIAGNLRVEEDAIRLHLKARPGDPFNPGLVDEDVKSVYRMGFFDDVKAELSTEGVLTYLVKERPYIREVKILGNAQVSRENIDTALGIKPRTILDRDRVSEGVERVKKLYAEQGYGNAQVDYAISPAENNQAVVNLNIEEGNRLLIEKISFEGNRAFSEGELKGVMATKEKWFLSFITNRGVLDHDVLTNDIALLGLHYSDHGYVNNKIDDPVILRRRDGIEVVIRVEEGDQYRVGKVEIGGDMIEEPERLLKKVQMTSGQIFRGSRLREDVTALTDRYANSGFAFAQVEPLTRIDSESKKIDVALVITRGPPVYFNRIMVAGNTKTRDKVVRREVDVVEQELFSGDKIKQSRNALQRTGYFEDVQLSTKRTDRPDTVDLLIDVKEGPTGSFGIGAGYSSGEAFVFNTSIAEKNLFGKGQSLSATFDIGTERQDFVVSFTEPYLYDTPLSFGVDGYNTKSEYSDFDSRKIGVGMRTSYPLKRMTFPFFKPSAKDSGAYEGAPQPVSLLDYMRAGMSYDLTQDKISKIDSDAPPSIQGEKGTSWTSSMTPNLSYDSRDHFFAPTEGTVSGLSVKFAGLGGDNRFIKADARARWYYSFLKDPNWGGTYTLALGGTLGYGVRLTERADGEKNLPLFERYFTGGINSVRGFKERSLGPKEQGCDSSIPPVCTDEGVGGDKLAVLNVELMFPVAEKYGIQGVTFFDMGQAFGYSESMSFGQFRRSVGVGARWLSPFGPLRVELGFPLNKQSGDETSVLGFSLGGQP